MEDDKSGAPPQGNHPASDEEVAALEAALTTAYAERKTLDLRIAAIQYRLVTSMRPQGGFSACPISI